MSNPSKFNNLVSISGAGKIIGCRMTVYRLISRGVLPEPERILGLPYLPKDVVDRVAATLKKKGKRKK